MKFLIGAAAIVLGIVAFMNTASLSPKFDYETATKEKREVWLDKQAKTIKGWSRFLLPSGRGPSELSFSVDGIETRSRTREIEMKIRVKVPYGRTVAPADYNQSLLKMCKKYVRTALYDQEVRFITTFKKEKGGVVQKLTASPRKCDRTLEEAV